VSQRFESLPNRERYRVRRRAGGCCQLCGDARSAFSFHDLGAEASDWIMLCHRCHRLVHPNGRPGLRITRATIDRAERFLCGLEPLSLRLTHHYYEDDA
jgi:hypothetical protein